MLAPTPQPPYYAVIFSSLLRSHDPEYALTAKRMEELAKKQPGYLGIESAREGIGITVSYWESLEAIKSWKQQAEHILAQERGKKTWYAQYKIRIAYVERDDDWAFAEKD